MFPPRSRLHLAEQLLDTLNGLQRVWEALWRDICESEGTHPSQGHALLFLLGRGAAPMHELSRALSIAPSTATRLVEQMEKEQWATRSPDREDRRRVLIHLLPDGEERAWTLRERARQELWRRSGRLVDPVGVLTGLDAVAATLGPDD